MLNTANERILSGNVAVSRNAEYYQWVDIIVASTISGKKLSSTANKRALRTHDLRAEIRNTL